MTATRRILAFAAALPVLTLAAACAEDAAGPLSPASQRASIDTFMVGSQRSSIDTFLVAGQRSSIDTFAVSARRAPVDTFAVASAPIDSAFAN